MWLLTQSTDTADDTETAWCCGRDSHWETLRFLLSRQQRTKRTQLQYREKRWQWSKLWNVHRMKSGLTLTQMIANTANIRTYVCLCLSDCMDGWNGATKRSRVVLSQSRSRMLWRRVVNRCDVSGSTDGGAAWRPAWELMAWCGR